MTAYDMRISYLNSDVFSSDLARYGVPGIAEFGNRHTLCDERIRQHPGIRVARTPGGSCINAQLLANTSRTSQFHCVDISAVFLFPYHRIRLKFTAKNCRFSGFLQKHMNRTAKYPPALHDRKQGR